MSALITICLHYPTERCYYVCTIVQHFHLIYSSYYSLYALNIAITLIHVNVGVIESCRSSYIIVLWSCILEGISLRCVNLYCYSTNLALASYSVHGWCIVLSLTLCHTPTLDYAIAKWGEVTINKYQLFSLCPGQRSAIPPWQYPKLIIQNHKPRTSMILSYDKR